MAMVQREFYYSDTFVRYCDLCVNHRCVTMAVVCLMTLAIGNFELQYNCCQCVTGIISGYKRPMLIALASANSATPLNSTSSLWKV